MKMIGSIRYNCTAKSSAAAVQIRENILFLHSKNKRSKKPYAHYNVYILYSQSIKVHRHMHTFAKMAGDLRKNIGIILSGKIKVKIKKSKETNALAFHR